MSFGVQLLGPFRLVEYCKGSWVARCQDLETLAKPYFALLALAVILFASFAGNFSTVAFFVPDLGLPFGRPLLFGAGDALLITRSLLTARGIGSSRSVSSFFGFEPEAASTESFG